MNPTPVHLTAVGPGGMRASMATINASMISEMSEPSTDDDQDFDQDGDLLSNSVVDDVTAQLMSAGGWE